MNLSGHLALTGIAVAALSPAIEGRDLLVFAAGSVLIDVDHYFLYVIRTGRYDIRGMFAYFHRLQEIETTIPYAGLCIFHTIDFFLLTALLAWFQPAFSPLLAGLLFHFAIDLLDLLRKGVPFIRPYFIVEHLIRRRTPGYPWY